MFFPARLARRCAVRRDRPPWRAVCSVLGRCLDKYPDPVEALKKYEQARVERTSRMVRGAKENTARFHESALATEEGAVAYMQSEWSRDPIRERYDWLYRYDVEAVPV